MDGFQQVSDLTGVMINEVFPINTRVKMYHSHDVHDVIIYLVSHSDIIYIKLFFNFNSERKVFKRLFLIGMTSTVIDK